jgi:hypothetical protein
MDTALLGQLKSMIEEPANNLESTLHVLKIHNVKAIQGLSIFNF